METTVSTSSVEKKFYLYQITNQVNGKLYIGQTTQDPKKRKADHWRCGKNNTGHCVALRNAIYKCCIVNLSNSEKYARHIIEN